MSKVLNFVTIAKFYLIILLYCIKDYAILKGEIHSHQQFCGKTPHKTTKSQNNATSEHITVKNICLKCSLIDSKIYSIIIL